MTQALPATPILVWLRQTAKQQRAALRAGQPDTKLHAGPACGFAHDYGFASWRALKAHIDSINRRRFAIVISVFRRPCWRRRDDLRRAATSGFRSGNARCRWPHGAIKSLRAPRREAIEVADAQSPGRQDTVRMRRCRRSRPSCGPRSPEISTRCVPASTRIGVGPMSLGGGFAKPRRCI